MAQTIKTKTPGRIKTAVLSWLGVPIDLTSGDFCSQHYGNQSDSGVSVTVTSAMQLDAVWSCVRLISETIATLPLSMYEKTATGKRVATQHPLHTVIHDQPNPDSIAAVFWEADVAAMLLQGCGRAEKLMAGNRVIGLSFLAPCRLTRKVTSSGTKTWVYREDNGKDRVIPDSRVWSIPGFSLDGVNGVSVMQYGAQVFGAAIAAEKAASKTFKNGLLQTLYYKISAFITPKQREDFKKNLAGTIERGEAPLLEGGLEAGTLGINPVDAQLLESRSFSVEAICRWFRVPPSMVGHGDASSNWGTGIEQQMIGFLTFTLGPWLRRIEQSISKDLLSPSERLKFYPKFNVEGLLRADSAGRAAFYGAMVNNGVLTRDEVRSLEDREPMGGNAAVLTVQSAMTTLDTLGTQPETQQIKSAMRAFLGFDEAQTKD